MPVEGAPDVAPGSWLRVLPGPSARPRNQCLVEQRTNPPPLLERGVTFLGLSQSHYVYEERIKRYCSQEVHGFGLTGQNIKPLRERLPRPRQALLNGGVRNRLDASERLHQVLLVSIGRGCKAKAAVSDHD